MPTHRGAKGLIVVGNMIVMGLPNFAELSDAAIAAESEASSSMAGDNLRSVEPSEFWRSESSHPLDTIFVLSRAGAAANMKGDGFALAEHNLRVESADFRVICSTSLLTLPTPIPPDVTFAAAATNTSEADASSLREGRPADNVWIGPTNHALPWSIRLSFPTPASDPRTGARRQAFAVFAQAADTADLFNFPTLKAELYEGGVLLANLGTKQVTAPSVDGTHGQWLIWRWDAADLGTADGSAVELKLTGTPNTVGTTVYTKVSTVDWIPELDEFTGGGIVYDSDWQTLPPDPVSQFDTFVPEDESQARSLIFDAGTKQTCKYVYFLLRDDQAEEGADPNSQVIPVADGYVEAGVAGFGVIFRPARNFNWGPYLGFRDLSEKDFTPGGQSFGVRNAVLRTLQVPLDFLSRAEAIDLADRLAARRGVHGPVFISLFPDDTSEQKLTTMYATLDGMPSLASIQAFLAGDSLRQLGLSFVEKR